MKNIVIAGASSKLIAKLENILSTSDIEIDAVCKSGNEVMALKESVTSAVLICGPLKDIPAIYLAKEIPDSWDLILLLSSSQPFPYYVSNVIPLNMPINRMEFIDTINSVATEETERYATKTTAKLKRSDDERLLIEKAKRKIMQERSIPESDAHKLLQRYSMNLSISMLESAKRFLNGN